MHKASVGFLLARGKLPDSEAQPALPSAPGAVQSNAGRHTGLVEKALAGASPHRLEFLGAIFSLFREERSVLGCY